MFMTSPNPPKIKILPHVDQHVFQGFHFFEGTARAKRHAGQWAVRDRNRQPGSVPQHQIEIAEQRAASSQHDPLVDDVGGEFGGGMFERYLDSFDDRTNRFGETLRDLTLADHDFLRHPVHQVASLDLHHAPLAVFRHAGGPYLLLDPLGAAFANEEIMVAPDIGDDRLIHLTSSDPYRSAIDNAAEGQHRNLGRSAPDIDDHRTRRFGHRKTGADRGRHRFFDKKDPPGARAFS